MVYSFILQRLSECKDVKKPNTSKVEGSTLGKLTVFDSAEKEVWSCFTCENIGPSTDIPKQDKRIIAREYSLEWTDSSKNAALAKSYPEYKAQNGRNVALLLTCDKELPEFRNRRILIHVGNYPQDTEGCILLGKTKNAKAGTVSNSVLACKEFFDLVKQIGIENIKCLAVKEI